MTPNQDQGIIKAVSPVMVWFGKTRIFERLQVGYNETVHVVVQTRYLTLEDCVVG